MDAFPNSVRNSNVLTGNDLGVLANVVSLPTKEDVDNFAKDHPEFMGLEMVKKHTFAQQYIEKNDLESAWKVLLLK